MLIVCIGDSLTYGLHLDRHRAWPQLITEMTGHKVRNEGKEGYTTQDMLNDFESDVLSVHPNMVIIMGGANDCVRGVDSDIAVSNIKKMVDISIRNRIIPLVMIQPAYEKGVLLEGSSEDPLLYMSRIRQSLLEYLKEADFVLLDIQEEFLKRYGKFVIKDIFLDGRHLNEKGHLLIARMMNDKLKGFV